MTTRNKTIYPPRDLYARPTAYPLHTPVVPVVEEEPQAPSLFLMSPQSTPFQNKTGLLAQEKLNKLRLQAQRNKSASSTPPSASFQGLEQRNVGIVNDDLKNSPQEQLNALSNRFGLQGTPITSHESTADTDLFPNPQMRADFSSNPQTNASSFKTPEYSNNFQELLNEYSEKYGLMDATPSTKKHNNDMDYLSHEQPYLNGVPRHSEFTYKNANDIFSDWTNAYREPSFTDKARLVRQKNTRQDWQATVANKLAKFMYTNPIGRAPGLMIQGIADAGMNGAGHIARAYGMDTHPLEPRNFYERALETIPRMVYNAAVTKVLTEGVLGGATLLGGKADELMSPLFKNLTPQILSKYPTLQKIGTQSLNFAKGTPLKILQKGQKIFNAAMMPSWKDLLLQNVATGTAESLFNPQTEFGKYLADVGGLVLLSAKNPLKAGIRTLPKTLLKKSSKQVVKKIAKKSKMLLKTPPKQLAKTLIQNPKVQEFGENVVIGEGAKRIIANILDPRSEMNSKARSLRKEDNSKSREAVPSLLPYNPLSNLHLNLMGIPSYSQIKFTQELLEPLLYDRRINGGVHR